MHKDAIVTLRDRILDAAEGVVVRQGIANLTLEAVAADAGMSKGGLLHHFPSKDKLIDGMVMRCADHWREHAREAYEQERAGPGRMARALLSHLEDPESWTEQCQRGSCAVFAALAQNPALIQPMRAVYSEIRGRLADDGLPEGVGETVIAAMDGLWLYRVLGLTEVDRKLMESVRRVLVPLLEGVTSASGGESGVGRGLRKAGAAKAGVKKPGVKKAGVTKVDAGRKRAMGVKAKVRAVGVGGKHRNVKGRSGR